MPLAQDLGAPQTNPPASASQPPTAPLPRYQSMLPYDPLTYRGPRLDPDRKRPIAVVPGPRVAQRPTTRPSWFTYPFPDRISPLSSALLLGSLEHRNPEIHALLYYTPIAGWGLVVKEYKKRQVEARARHIAEQQAKRRQGQIDAINKCLRQWGQNSGKGEKPTETVSMQKRGGKVSVVKEVVE